MSCRKESWILSSSHMTKKCTILPGEEWECLHRCQQMGLLGYLICGGLHHLCLCLWQH